MNIKQRATYIQQFGSCFTLRAFYYQKMVNLSDNNRKIRFSDKLNQLKMEKLEIEFSEYIQQRVDRWKNNRIK